MASEDGRIVVGDAVKLVDDARRTEQPPGIVARLMEHGTKVRVQPFDLMRDAWTAGIDEVEPDDGVWLPDDGAKPDDLLPFPIPPGTIAPRRYGGLRPKRRPGR